jgi:hypothetical protein
MYLQISKNGYQNESPPGIGSNDYFYKGQPEIHVSEGVEFETAQTVNLPILATANDLREVVKFFKHKPNGVSVIEMTNAEPRRVFDARKIAAYEFWGIISHADERFLLTPLGEELAKNTEAECEIHRRILRAVPAYLKAVEWIFKQNLQIATYLDVANFWQLSGSDLALSRQNDENIEAVIVSLFSLCHAAELGTATVGKRGQPARLSVRLDQIKAFLNAPIESVEFVSTPNFNHLSVYQFDKIAAENVACVYISAGNRERESENLRAALELADFQSITFGIGGYENGFLPLAQRAAMKQCQTAIFLLDEKDLQEQNGKVQLRCDRVTEISVAQALFNERVIVLWNSGEIPPKIFNQTGSNVFNGDVSDWESNVKLVKCLKNLKS